MWLLSALVAVTFLVPDVCRASDKSATNLALGRGVTVDSENEHGGSHAVDGTNHTYWQSERKPGTHWIAVELEKPYEIDRIVLTGYSGIDSLTIQTWNGSEWVDAFSGKTQDNVLFAIKPVTTSRVRISAISEQVSIEEISIFETDRQPVFVNQSGYDLSRSKRFTAPRAEEGSSFVITRAGRSEVLYTGIVRNHIGDFTDFMPAEDIGPYVIEVKGREGTGKSVPFNIAPYWIERVSYKPAIDFMIDARCWYGDSRGYNPTDENADCPSLGVGWRDSHQFSFEIPTLLAMYFANPDAFSTRRMPVQGRYLGLREELPENTPEIIRLIYWAVDIYLRGQVDHTLLKEQLAYFVYAYPHLADYIPERVYEEARDYVFEHWGDPQIVRWRWHDIEHSADLFQTYTVIGTGKGQFPPGHSIVPNLMMYEVAKREGCSDAERFFDAAFRNTSWIIKNLDWHDPLTTKGQRQGEHITVTSLAYFLKEYPENAPAGLRDKIREWAEVAVARSNNMWDFRKYSEERWIIPTIRAEFDPRFDSATGFNEVGNVAGFPAPALAAARVLEDEHLKKALRRLAVAHVDNVFGRNPTGRHYSFDAVDDFEGVEIGWYKEYQGGAGQLQSARGVLDGSPKETTYPFDPYAGDPGHTEGWVTFNTAWNAALAYLAVDATGIDVFDGTFEQKIESAAPGSSFGVRLRAPLNFDHQAVETGQVKITTSGGDTVYIEVRETSANGQFFQGLVATQSGPVDPSDGYLQVSPGDTVTISYGYGVFKKEAVISM